jgi:uncharacterized membrane protein
VQVTGSSSFQTHGMPVGGPFGPIHRFSVGTLIALMMGVHHAVAGRIQAHQDTMRSLYFWALGIAGLFTLLPGQVMHRVLFGEDSVLGFITIALVALLAGLLSRSGLRLRKT